MAQLTQFGIFSASDFRELIRIPVAARRARVLGAVTNEDAVARGAWEERSKRGGRGKGAAAESFGAVKHIGCGTGIRYLARPELL
jgi:hypothetical protein